MKKKEYSKPSVEVEVLDMRSYLLAGSSPHNLEVPGSSPGWSTLKIKHLRVSRKCFFHVCVNNA